MRGKGKLKYYLVDTSALFPRDLLCGIADCVFLQPQCIRIGTSGCGSLQAFSPCPELDVREEETVWSLPSGLRLTWGLGLPGNITDQLLASKAGESQKKESLNIYVPLNPSQAEEIFCSFCW